VRFEWDSRKAKANLRKHGVSFEEAQTVFDDPLVMIEADWEHGEQRDIAIGMSGHDRLLFTVTVETDEGLIRIISARKAGLHERRRYQEGG
jgi:uncharacterized DUF497 family protein